MRTNTIDTGHAGSALGAAIERLGGEIGRFFAAMAEGARAAHEYDRLSRTSDPALAREGLSRDGIARAVMERHFR